MWPGAGHSRGVYVGSHIQKIWQRNTAETPLVNLIKKQHATKKKKKKSKKLRLDCTLPGFSGAKGR